MDADESLVNEIVTAALRDTFYAVRGIALQSIQSPTAAQTEIIRAIALNDDHSQVRAAAIDLLTQAGDKQLAEIARAAMEARPYPVVAAGLEALVTTDSTAALEAAGKLEEVDNESIAATLANLYSEKGAIDKLPYFERQIESVDGYSAISLFTAYQNLLSLGGIADQTAGVSGLQDIALDQSQSPWRRLAATKAISDLRGTLSERVAEMADNEELNKMIMEMGTSLENIKATETDADLQRIYQQF
jgi:aminopeptidase N